MTKEINKQEQAKRQNGLWTGLTVAMVLVVGLVTLSGCSKNGASNVNTSPIADKIYKVDELAALALADKDAWTGKEVTVTGFVLASDDPGEGNVPGYKITLKNENFVALKSKNGVPCQVPQGNIPEGLLGKTLEVKGKIKSVESQSELKWITLDPCELKK